MANETAMAVLVTILSAVVLLWSGRGVQSWLRAREKRQAQIAESHLESARLMESTRCAMLEVGKVVASAIQNQNENIASWMKTLSAQMEENTKASVVSLDPEVRKRLSMTVERLAEVLEKHGTSIERFGDAAVLIAASCRKMNDNIVALRAIVFGGKRAEDFSFTAEDPETVRRADMENDIVNLMQDQGLSRAEATQRVKSLFSMRPIGL